MAEGLNAFARWIPPPRLAMCNGLAACLIFYGGSQPFLPVLFFVSAPGDSSSSPFLRLTEMPLNSVGRGCGGAVFGFSQSDHVKFFFGPWVKSLTRGMLLGW